MPFQTVQFCSVKGCSNTTQSVDGQGIALNFFTLPTEEPERELWVKFLNRPNIEMNDQLRVCSAHFPDGEPTQLYPAPCLSGPSHQGNSQLLEPVKTHPSVRVKGTEVSFTPFNCTDPTCPNKSLHMHCPFCVRTECYQDPVILKMHYRVKHVDKGIDFAGLKILRCCDRCEIVGAIKGEKIFKGAHWHCYKCRNGFNRRDEAIKHYKTHFRNPETTFQIQISQIEDEGARQEQSTASSTLANGIMVRSCTPSSHKTAGEVQVPVAANETVGPSEPQTIMIIQESAMDANNSSLENSYTVIPADQYSDDNSVVEEVLADLPDAQHHTDDQLKRPHHEESISQLLSQNAQLKADVAELKNKVIAQSKELERSRKREQELVQHLSIPLEQGIQELLKDMEKKHMELLHQQLGALRRNYLSQLSKQNQTITIPSAALQNAVLGAESGSISITIQRNGVTGDGLDDSQGTTLEVEQFSQPERVDNQVMETGEGTVLHLMPVSRDQQHLQLTTGGPFTVSSPTTVAQTMASTDTTSYESSLQTVSLESPTYSFAAQTIQVDGTHHLEDVSECTPAKRSRTDSS